MNSHFRNIFFIGYLALLGMGVENANAAIPLQRVILDGKVVTADDQTPLNRVWLAVYAGGNELGWEWTRSDGSFHFKQPLSPGTYQLELKSENKLIKDASTQIFLPELAPGETEETLFLANRFMSARKILEDPVNVLLTDQVARKTGYDKKTVTDVMTAIVDVVNEYSFPEYRVFTLEKAEPVPLRTVNLRGSVRGLLGRGRLRGGIVKFLWNDYLIAEPRTGANDEFLYESVQMPVGKITVVASDRYSLFQQVKREYVVTPETSVLQVDDLVCSLRLWVKMLLALIGAALLWLVLPSRRSRPQTPTAPIAPPGVESDSDTKPILLSVDSWRRNAQLWIERIQEAVKRTWRRTPDETRDRVAVSTWFWMHGILCLVLVLWVGLQLYGNTIQASGPLASGEAAAVSHAQQLRDATAESDRELCKNALQVNADFTPFQVFIWSRILSISAFHQTAWQCAHLALFCVSGLMLGLAAWMLSQRVFRFSTTGSSAGLCATALFLLCPVALRYSCTLYPETLSLFFVTASLTVWLFAGVLPERPTFIACSLLLAAAFLTHPMHGLIIALVLIVATGFRGGLAQKTFTDLGFLFIPAVIAVTVFSRVFLPDTRKVTYAFLARGDDLGWFQGIVWCFGPLLSDYSPYRQPMVAVLFLIVAVVWISADRKVRGLAAGLVAGLLLISLNSGKYYSSLLALIPVIVLFPALAVEAIVAHRESQKQKSYALTVVTLVFFLGPFVVDMYAGLYQRA
ncbi:MAG: hypothetical protein ABIH23_24685, partial [bacterium]